MKESDVTESTRSATADVLGDISLGPLLARQGVLSITGDMLGRGLKYITLIVLARLLNTDLLGGFVVAAALTEVMVLVASLGFNAGIVRFGTELLRNGQKEKLQALFNWSIARSGALSIVISLVWFVASLLALNAYRGGDVFLFLRVIIWCLPIMVATTAMVFVTVAMKTILYQKLAQMVVQPGLLFVISMAAFLLDATESRIVVVMVAYVVSWIVTFVFVFVVLRRLGIVGQARGTLQQADAKRMWAFSLPTVGSSLVNVLRQQADILLITFFLSTGEVALYNVAARTAAILTLALLGFISIIDPLVVDYGSRGDTRLLTKTCSLITRWALSFCLPVALVVFTYPSEILVFFGEDFLGASSIVRILVLGQVLNVATGLAGRILLMTDHQNLVLYDNIGFLVVNLGLNLAFIPRFGPVGAAIASAFSLAALNIVRFLQARWLVGVGTGWSVILKPFFAAVVVGLCIMVLRGYLVAGSVWSVGIALIVSFVLYFVVLAALGLEWEEKRLLASFLSLLRSRCRGRYNA